MATTIKKVKCINNTGRWDLLTSGRTYNVTKIIGNYAYVLDGVKYMHSMDRFEDVIEPDFKVGDKVVFARKDEGDMSLWNKEFTIGKEYTVLEPGMGNSIRVDTGYIMPKECFDLAPEPKPEPKPKTMSKFKVGDFVKVIEAWVPADKKHVGKIAKVVEVAGPQLYELEDVKYDASKRLLMFGRQLELAEEPKPEPEFKVGDFVKVTREIVATDIQHLGKVAKVIKVTKIGDEYLCRLDGVSLLMYDFQLELAKEPKPLYQTHIMGEWGKPEAKERATVKKVRCIDATYSRNLLETNKVYVIEGEGEDSLGREYYCFKSTGVQRFHKSRFVDVVEEKYPIIEEIFGDTIVFNPPYTIAKLQVKYGPEKGKWFIGKAKCNPNDTYDKWTGFKIAHQRMRESTPCSK